MLMTREFDMTRSVANSDGEAIAELGTSSFVAVYDDNFVGEAMLKEFIDEFDGSDNVAYAKGTIVVLPADIWQNLREMILANYEMVEK